MQNAEIFTLTYGSMVRQLLTDLEDVTEVNKQLDKMWAAILSLLLRTCASSLQGCYGLRSSTSTQGL